MSTHPINLLVRFLLELIVLAAVGYWGWKQGNELTRYLYVIGIPIILMTIWGVFAVPDDPSRSGNAPIPTPGVIRLLVELLFFALGVGAFFDLGMNQKGMIFGALVVLHYALSYDRMVWLLSK